MPSVQVPDFVLPALKDHPAQADLPLAYATLAINQMETLAPACNAHHALLAHIKIWQASCLVLIALLVIIRPQPLKQAAQSVLLVRIVILA